MPHPGVLFDWTLILCGTRTDPLRSNSHISVSLPSIPPSSKAPTTVMETTEGTSRGLSGQCLQTGSGNKYLKFFNALTHLYSFLLGRWVGK